MQVERSGDHDRIEVIAVEHQAVVVVPASESSRDLQALLEVRLVDIADGRHFHARDSDQLAEEHRPLAAGPDEPTSDLLHVGLLSGYARSQAEGCDGGRRSLDEISPAQASIINSHRKHLQVVLVVAVPLCRPSYLAGRHRGTATTLLDADSDDLDLRSRRGPGDQESAHIGV